MAKPGLVIFDCDGVLVDSEPLSIRVLLEVLAREGVTLDIEAGYARFLGRSLATIRQDLETAFGIVLDDAALEAHRRTLYATFRNELQPIPGIALALPRLTAPFCVASSSLPERIELSLRVTGLWPHFEGRAFSATMVARGKPAPDLFLHAAATMGQPAEAAVVVEDSPVGVQAAQAAGMRVVGFLGGSHAQGPAHRAALEALAPDALIDDMTALPDLLATL
jgi:HAD superfamily hydrolase (TIGR01509 family)